MKRNMILLMLGACGVMIALAVLLTARGVNAGWLVFLLCPLMHIFMMGGHNHGGHDHHDSTETDV